MPFLSQILRDLAEECKMPPVMFSAVWNRILQAVKQKKIQERE